MDDLKQEVIKILRQYLGEDETIEKISILSDRAISAYMEYRNYPSTWDDDAILADMTKHISCISDLALYECTLQGAEFQSMHIESGAYRMWNSKGSVFTQHRVVPFVTV